MYRGKTVLFRGKTVPCPCSLHHAGRRDALCEVGHEGPRGVAARVVGAVRAVVRRIPSEAAEAARRVRRHRPHRGLVN